LISINSKYQATILIVESNPATAQMLLTTLRTKGYNSVLASSGQEAIEKIQAPVDLILLDLLLSDMEGKELCHYLKQSEATNEIPIIMLSSDNGRNNEKLQCIQLGADYFVRGPLEREELLIRVENILQMRSGSRPQRAERLRELKRILEYGLVEPHFQPIYTFDPPGLLGVEVLSRPQTDSMLKNPELLFETALEFGFYFDLEMMAWKKALDIFNKDGKDQKLFLNCSPYLVEDDHFLHVHEMFQKTMVNASDVFFELTERSAISQHKLFHQRLCQYRDSGFRIAVDDLGSGYSSLEAIVEIHPEVVKIDQQIVHDLVEDPYKSSMVKFIVSFCLEHDIICVAEGVETKEELRILKDLGVKACQGYYFYRPTPHLDVSAFRSILV
jgi:EAL domain-containing protein (putative c-di-GMP-specific phosphodiesterase class I)/CheY-like chemotaxis protein